ncbi:MAG: hypothetical protein IJC16_03810 [Rikenellaceae bacterium]|nr:hypothetical protein [Rikenellaceae bacterium]
MRLWSIHPRYLDAAGLTACWREGLLARKVLAGATRGYRRHPQLDRFRRAADPVAAIDAYLSAVHDEAQRRGYRFDRALIGTPGGVRLTVTRGQLVYELEHLRGKLVRRDPARCAGLPDAAHVAPHPMFDVVEGPPESWERVR